MQFLTNKCTGDFLAAKTLKEKFGGLHIMKSVANLDETPSALERSFKAATKLRRELPTDIEMESIPLEELLQMVFMLKQEKYDKKLTLTCENF